MKNPPPPLKTLAFHREFGAFRGGHLKVWHYFCHAKASRVFRPTIHLAPGSILDESNPWISAADPIQSAWVPDKADALFLAGTDWLAVPKDCATPAINLVMHVRHGDPADPRHAFLSRRAFRICLSKEVEIAILATGKVNGPVITIPASLDFDGFPEPPRERDIPLLIAGLKKPKLATEISCELDALGIVHTCLPRALPRLEFLALLGRAAVTLFLPNAKEGFYLPALEGMAMGTVVVCPDCVANRGFCLNGINCLRPDADKQSILASVLRAVQFPAASQEALRNAARETVNEHRLARERERFLEILDQVGNSI